MPLDSRTRAILRNAELGFFGVMVLTCRHTPRLCGQAFKAGDLVFFFLDEVCLIFFSSIYHLLHMEICVPGAGIYGYQLETQDGQPVEHSVQSGLIADRAGQDCFSLRRVTHRQSS